MAAKYQVFVSSTYSDLTEERDQIIKAVLEMGHIPVGMEMFSAADEEQWQIIARHIDESDYYVALIAHRLGSMTPEGISYTRKEYEYARKKGIPSLAFLIDDQAPWPTDRVDTKTAEKEALDAFKSLVKEKPVGFWSSAEDLHGKFSIALMKAITSSPRPGWVRATELAGPEVTSELIRLSSENAKLREQLGDAAEAATQEHADTMERALRTLFGAKRIVSYRYTPRGDWEKTEVSLFRVFGTVAPEMMVDSAVEELADSLAMNIREDKEKPWDIVAINQMRGLLADLMTLDLVRPSTRRHAVSDNREYWSLTEFGLEALKRVRQVTLNAQTTAEPEDSPTSHGDGDATPDPAQVDGEPVAG